MSLDRTEYKDYISSEAWRKKRNQRIAIDRGKCVICGSTENLNVHHLTYERLGEENVDEDLVTMCEKCHIELWHGGIEKGKRIVQDNREIACDKAWKAVRKIQAEYCEMNGEQLSEVFSELFKSYTISGAGMFCKLARAIQEQISMELPVRRNSRLVNFDALFSGTTNFFAERIIKKLREKGYRKPKKKVIFGPMAHEASYNARMKE